MEDIFFPQRNGQHCHYFGQGCNGMKLSIFGFVYISFIYALRLKPKVGMTKTGRFQHSLCICVVL